jgi:hypothetical protein
MLDHKEFKEPKEIKEIQQQQQIISYQLIPEIPILNQKIEMLDFMLILKQIQLMD